MSSAAAGRSEHFRTNIRSRGAFWALFLGLPVAALIGYQSGDVRILAAAPVVVVLLVVLFAYSSAAKRAEEEFFAELAPTLGLTPMPAGRYAATTPLLAAGERQKFENTMEGPLFGKLGGPRCWLGHFTYETRYAYEADHSYDDVEVWKPSPFTVCAADLGDRAMSFGGLYLRPRLSRLALEGDWLRGRNTERVQLESAHFNEAYDLQRGPGQDELRVRELFSPSFVVWLTEHPLQPGFECNAGTLVVFVRGHLDSAGRITLLHEAAREIARRIERQVNEGAGLQPHFSAAGQTIR